MAPADTTLASKRNPAPPPPPGERGSEAPSHPSDADTDDDTPTLIHRTEQLVLGLRAALADTNPTRREQTALELLRVLVTEDPVRAAQLVAALELGPTRVAMLRCIAQQWTAIDSAAAIAWAAELELGTERVQALIDVCFGIAESNVPAAVMLAERFNLGGCYGTLENLVQRWADADLPAATNWVRDQPAGEQRDLALARLANRQAQEEPAKAVALILEYMSPGPAQSEAALSVLHQWARRDHAAASAWVARFPEGPLRDQALEELAGFPVAPTSPSPRSGAAGAENFQQ